MLLGSQINNEHCSYLTTQNNYIYTSKEDDQNVTFSYHIGPKITLAGKNVNLCHTNIGDSTHELIKEQKKWDQSVSCQLWNPVHPVTATISCECRHYDVRLEQINCNCDRDLFHLPVRIAVVSSCFIKPDGNLVNNIIIFDSETGTVQSILEAQLENIPRTADNVVDKTIMVDFSSIVRNRIYVSYGEKIYVYEYDINYAADKVQSLLSICTIEKQFIGQHVPYINSAIILFETKEYIGITFSSPSYGLYVFSTRTGELLYNHVQVKMPLYGVYKKHVACTDTHVGIMNHNYNKAVDYAKYGLSRIDLHVLDLHTRQIETVSFHYKLHGIQSNVMSSIMITCLQKTYKHESAFFKSRPRPITDFLITRNPEIIESITFDSRSTSKGSDISTSVSIDTDKQTPNSMVVSKKCDDIKISLKDINYAWYKRLLLEYARECVLECICCIRWNHNNVYTLEQSFALVVLNEIILRQIEVSICNIIK